MTLHSHTHTHTHARTHTHTHIHTHTHTHTHIHTHTIFTKQAKALLTQRKLRVLIFTTGCDWKNTIIVNILIVDIVEAHNYILKTISEANIRAIYIVSETSFLLMFQTWFYVWHNYLISYHCEWCQLSLLKKDHASEMPKENFVLKLRISLEHLLSTSS